MKKYSITSKYTAAVPRSQRRKNVEGRSVVAGYSAGGGSGVDRSYVDANFVTLATEQVVTAHKDFAAGISMYGIPWEYDVERDAWTIKGNVIITKGLATYSALKEDDVLSVFDGLPIDNNTLQWQESEGGKILVAVGGGSGGGIDEDKLKDYLDKEKYVTESWVTGKNYALKSDLDTVSTKLNNFLEGSDTDAIINKWSELEVFLSGLAETDNLAEILSTKFDKSDFTKANIKDKLGIADWALAATNPSYTKAEAFDNFVSRTTAQDIRVVHNFTNGIKLFGKLPFSYNATKDAWELDGNLVITKGLATYTKLSGFEDLGIMAAIEVDGTTISKDGGVLHFVGNASGGVDEGAVNTLISKALVGYATESWVTSKGYALQTSLTAVDNRLKSVGTFFATDDTDSYVNKWDEIVTFLDAVEGDTLDSILSTKADTTTKISAGTGLTGGGTLAANRTLSLATVGTAGTYTKVTTDSYGRVTSGTTLSASDIPSLSWSKITSGKPTSLSGYGITDAYTKTDADERYLRLATGGEILGNVTVKNSSSMISAHNKTDAIGLHNEWNCGLWYNKGTSTNTSKWLLAFNNERTGAWFTTPLAVGTTSANTSYMLYVNGATRIAGQLSTTTSSDRRLKENIRKADVGMYLRSLGGAFAFEYIGEEVERDEFYSGTHIGFIYQNIKSSLLSSMCIEREDGYGSLNYLHSDYLGLLGAAAISHEDRLAKVEKRVEQLEKE